MVNIRTFKKSDRKKVIAIWNEVFTPQKPHNTPELVFDMKIKHKDNLLFVAEDKNLIVGTVIAGFDGHRGWLYSLAVLPRYRHRGIGTLLVHKALDELKSLGCVKVNLQIYGVNNSVVDFYTKIGFSIEDRISMGKTLYNKI